MNVFRSTIIIFIFLIRSTPLFAEDLSAYSEKCNRETGVVVPDFNCDSGTLVPTTNANGSSCDRPNQLNQVCDPGSKFQVLVNTPSAFVVAHCRKTGLQLGQFGDIAVIQHNKNNGATCFYQGALGTLSHSGNVKAPAKGVGNPTFWMTPSAIASSSFACVRCHDNGAIIRSPYLTQITGANQLPGAHDTSFNRNQPYYFVGEDFASWKAFSVDVAGNLCLGCHRLGVSNKAGGSTGTAIDFAIRATAASQKNKNPHSIASPMWMLPALPGQPAQTTPSPLDQAAALEIKNCALRFNEANQPNGPSCSIKRIAGTSIGTVVTPPQVSLSGYPKLTGPDSSDTGIYDLTPNKPDSPFYLHDIWRKVPGGNWAPFKVSYGYYPVAEAAGGSGQYQYKTRWLNPSQQSENLRYSGFSDVISVNVSIDANTAPTEAPSLQDPGTSTSGNYTLSWNSVPRAKRYNLEISEDNTTWNPLNPIGLSYSLSNQPNSTWYYRVTACNDFGCGPTSTTLKVIVDTFSAPIPAAPSFVRLVSMRVVAWGSVTGAAYYELQSLGSGGWETYYTGSSAGTWYTGPSTFRVRACNLNDECSDWVNN
jgi:hypothetical protein